MKLFRKARTKLKNIPRRKVAAVFIAVMTALLVLLTVLGLFLIQHIRIITVKGESLYTDEQLIAAAEIEYGEPLFSIDTDEVEKKLLENSPYIREVKVTCWFFSRLTIKVVADTPKFYISLSEHQNGVYILSDKLRVLDFCTEEKADELGLIYLELPKIDSCRLGKTVTLVEPEKNGYVYELLDYFFRQSYAPQITAIGLSSRFDKVFVEYYDKCRIKLGSSENIEEKMTSAQLLIDSRIAESGIDNLRALLSGDEYLIVNVTGHSDGNTISFTDRKD